MTNRYQPWLALHRRSAADTVARLLAMCSGELHDVKLSALTAWHVERWRSARLKAGRTAETANRDLAALRAILSRGVEWGHLQVHPLRSVRALREHKADWLRYLLAAEETRSLHTALRRVMTTDVPSASGRTSGDAIEATIPGRSLGILRTP